MAAPGKDMKANRLPALTEAQEAAIAAPIDRPLVILAAAGSGKTSVLCHRIAHIISQGVPSKDVLAVTFTRRAGQDLLQRIRNVVATVGRNDEGMRAIALDGIRVGTFHSFCLSILRTFPERAGLAPGFTIFTPIMQVALLQELVEEFYAKKSDRQQDVQLKDGVPVVNSERKSMFKREALRLLQRIRRWQTSLPLGSKTDVSHSDFGIENDGGLLDWVYGRYNVRLQEANGLDFNSFVRMTVELLREHPDALQTTQVHAQYVLVDEFQDTDACQFELLRVLCENHKRLTVVGDDDQQIYSWRGATGFQNLAKFHSFFPGSTIVKLEQNFRSTGAIVAAARMVIKGNRKRVDKTIRTIAPTGALLSVCECRNEQCEADMVAEFILAMKNQGIPLHDIVVLYRLQRVGLDLQHKLQARGIACQIKGSGSAANHVDGLGRGPEGTGGAFEDVMAILRLVVNDRDDLSCKQLMDLVCPVLSPAFSRCLRHLQLKRSMSLLNALKSTRAHLLGIFVSEDLESCEPLEEDFGKSKSEKAMFDGMLKVVQMVSSTREEVQSGLSVRDILRNVLQQISPYRRSAHESLEHLKSTPKEDVKGYAFAYAGIKALFREATLFDAEDSWGLEPPVSSDLHSAPTMSEGCSDFKRRKVWGQRAASLTPSRISPHARREAVEKMRRFLDRVLVKLHDHELGESGNSNGELDSDKGPYSSSSACTPDTVTLSTIHQAKGLEWEAVVLVHANEGYLPARDYNAEGGEMVERNAVRKADSGVLRKCSQSKTASDDKVIAVDMAKWNSKLESAECHQDEASAAESSSQESEVFAEERRLLYVGLTRAKRFILITHVMMADGQPHAPSRFLGDIPRGLTEKTVRYESDFQIQKSLPCSSLKGSDSSKEGHSVKNAAGKKPRIVCGNKDENAQTERGKT